MWLHRRPPLAALLLHAGLLTAIYSALYCFGFVNKLPTNESLYAWDVGDLLRVKNSGYPDPARGYNAFFPLVPLVWRYAHLDLLQAALLNAALAGTGLYLLARTFALNGRQTLLLASAPLMMFTLVPYTEGFFFLFGALLLRGLHRNTLPLTLLGLFGCCLTRSAGTLFLPAYVFAELLTWGTSSDSTGGRVVRNVLAGTGAMAASFGIVMLMQWHDGGDPLAFYHAHALWKHRFSIPVEFLFSSAGPTMLWLDIFVLMMSFLSLVGCAVLGIRWLAKRGGAVVSKATLFALGYTAGAGFFILFYQASDVVGLSRYLLATPFWGALLAWAWAAPWPRRRVMLALAAVATLVGALLGLPNRMTNFGPGEGAWFIGLLWLYAASYWLTRPDQNRWHREVATGLYCVNLFALCFILNLFLNGIWVN